MRCIPLKDAQIGMLLAADVLNGQDMLLLKKGAALTEKNLRMLKSWGIGALHVQPTDGNSADKPDPCGSSNEIGKVVEARFGDTLSDPIMAEICRVASGIIHERNRLK